MSLFFSFSHPDHSEGKKKKSPFNYVHYDPELHWCAPCNVFPKTAKDYLMHLHTTEHRRVVGSEENSKEQAPWRDELDTEDTMVNPEAPTKRTPIRGLQFFVPATAWYCKLCHVWMGDMNCASWHWKSQTHAEAYGVRDFIILSLIIRLIQSILLSRNTLTVTPIMKSIGCLIGKRLTRAQLQRTVLET